MYALAFPPIGLAPLAWVALAPLYLACFWTRPRRAFAAGLLWCVTASVGVAGFLPEMIADFFGASAVLGWLVFGGVMLIVAPLYGSYAAWISWLTRQRTASLLAAAAGWGVCEWLRLSLPPPTGWALLAYSQASAPVVLQVADVAGSLGLGMLLAAVSFGLAALIAPSQRLGLARGVGIATIALAVVAYGAWRLSQTFAYGEPVTVALVQPAGDREHRPGEERRDARLDRYLALSKVAAAEVAADLVVWPEHAVDFYLREPSPQRTALFDAARGWKADLILGGPHYRSRNTPPRYHNSVFLIRDARFAGRYDKVKLLPFAESNPLQAFFPRDVHTSPGERLQPLEATSLRTGVFVCSEALEPELARKLAGKGAELFVNPSSDHWFGSAAAARLQLYSAVLRAVENRRHLVRTTAGGHSAIVDPHGRVQRLADFGASDVLVGEVRASSAVTPYQRTAGVAPWAALAVVAITSMRRSGLHGSTRRGGNS
jgi:apolipoprotein N-acyltransferase